MSTTLTVDLTSDDKQLSMELKKVGAVKTWRTLSGDCLVVDQGAVDDSAANDLLCHSGVPDKTPVMLFFGMTWDTGAGGIGDSRCDLCVGGCPSDWSWTIRSSETPKKK